MRGLYRIKRYSDCLFFGHIVLEKILKAHVVRYTKKQAPYTHNLRLLAELIRDVNLSDREWQLLADVNEFNIRTRYPDAKLAFYKLCTKSYTDKYRQRITKLYKRLCLK